MHPQPIRHPREIATPLHDVELEAAILGGMLIESGAVLIAASILRDNAAVFHLQRHQLVFEAMVALQSAGMAVDTISVFQQMQQAGTAKRVGGPGFIAGLTERINTAGNFNTHCHFLLQLYTKRSLAKMGAAMMELSQNYSSDAHELLSEAQAKLNDIHAALQLRKPQKVADNYHRVVDKIVLAAKNKTGITGVPTGLWALDKITGGWQPGNLIIIAARPGMGKTSLMLAAGRNSATAGRPGLFISLEMSSDELVTKLIATELSYTTSQLTKGVGIDEEEAESIRARATKVLEAGIVIDDTPALGINELRAKAAKARQEHGIEWIMVDYLQLMRGESGGNREQEIGSISRGLKLLAKELSIPVIAAAQLSRAVETRGGDCIPKLSDLRESGSIEMDADLVIFPYRPEYYKIMEDEFGNPTNDLTHLIVAKHRNGGLDTAIVRSVMKHGRYEDLEENAPFEVPGRQFGSDAGQYKAELPMSNFDNESAF